MGDSVPFHEPMAREDSRPTFLDACRGVESLMVVRILIFLGVHLMWLR
jgi:hypothetical protein